MKDMLPIQPIEITRTIKEKIYIISWTWFLLIFVYQNILYTFIDDLNQAGKINFGEEFSSYHWIWTAGFFPNLLKILIDIVIALLGGITVGYLLTRVRITFKYLYAFLSTILQMFLFFIIIVIVMRFIKTGTYDYSIGSTIFYMIEYFRSAPIYFIFMIVSLVCIFLSYYFGINWGMKLKEDNYFGTDAERRDTFLDLKWYHWLWFWIPIGIYFKMILWVVFNTVSSIFKSFASWKIFEIIGLHISEASKEPSSSIGSIIFWGMIVIVAFFYQLKLIWDILTGRRVFKNKFISYSLVFFFSFIAPFVIVYILYLLSGKK